MTERYKAFPPGIGNVKIPISSREAARAGLSMYAPCRWRGVLIRRVAWQLVAFLGPRVIPGRLELWQPPMAADEWSDLINIWRQTTSAFDGFAAYERRQGSRVGLALLLLRQGDPVAFVKLRNNESAPLENEFRALLAARHFRASSFLAPEPLALSKYGTWHYLMTSALPTHLHRMPKAPPMARILDEIRSSLAALERPSGTPKHWEPMHGDFTPWNLREAAEGALELFDWENAGWGPPRADEVLYEAVVQVLTGIRTGLETHPEAQSFWKDRVSVRLERGREASDRDLRLNEGLLKVLES